MAKVVWRTSAVFLALLVAFVLILTAACPAPPTPTPTPAPKPGPSPTLSPTISMQLSVTASGLAFDKKTITVPAGASITMTFDNQDSVVHNFALYKDASATDNIFAGKLISGPDTTTYTFTAPSEKGTYYFRCDIHLFMNGQFIVE